MKTLLFLLITISIDQLCTGQKPFLFLHEQPEIDQITDAIQVDDKFYMIMNRVFNHMPPYDWDSYCDLLITSDEGILLDQIALDPGQSHYHRFWKAENNEIYIIGQLKSDTCKNQLVISRFNIETNDIVHLTRFDFCDHEIQKIKIIPGLHQKVFLEEFHSKNQGLAKHIYEIDSAYQISLILDSVSLWSSLSIDFSRNGYLISDQYLKRFYDADFNFRKQKLFHEEVSSQNETYVPFADHYIILQTIVEDGNSPYAGFNYVVIDSNLSVIKRTAIQLDPSILGTEWAAYYGGLVKENDNAYWTAAHKLPNPNLPQIGYFLIAKLDSNLNIICQHFVGYDSWYRTYGLRPLESGGAIVTGTRLRDGLQLNDGLDVFALRVGENCELPTTSVENGKEEPILSISAYPNPGYNDLTFSVNGFDATTLRIELIDELGRILFRTNDLSYSIQVPDLPAGQYFYRILQDQKLLGIGSWVKQ